MTDEVADAILSNPRRSVNVDESRNLETMANELREKMARTLAGRFRQKKLVIHEKTLRKLTDYEMEDLGLSNQLGSRDGSTNIDASPGRLPESSIRQRQSFDKSVRAWPESAIRASETMAEMKEVSGSYDLTRQLRTMDRAAGTPDTAPETVTKRGLVKMHKKGQAERFKKKELIIHQKTLRKIKEAHGVADGSETMTANDE